MDGIGSTVKGFIDVSLKVPTQVLKATEQDRMTIGYLTMLFD